MQHLQLNNTFWQFALSFYKKAGVAQKLLQLQDEFGLDINLLLYMVWLGEKGIVLKNAELQPILLLASDWQHNIMQPLRQARRQIKAFTGDSEHYKKAKTLELAIEQEIMARLFQLTPMQPFAGKMVIDENLDGYLRAVKPQQYAEIQPLMDFYR